MQPYVIRPGDYLSQLAQRFRFDADEVWNSPKNAALRKLRGRPEVLHPGDLIFFEPGPPDWLSFKAGTSNTYEMTVPTTTIRLHLKDAEGKALARKKFYLNGSTEPAGTTGGDGLLECKVPLQSRIVVISVEDCETVYQFRVGHLDPIDTPSGLRQRLTNLGYLADLGSEDELVQDALSRFQQMNDLTPTGKLDDKTKDALEKAYGI